MSTPVAVKGEQIHLNGVSNLFSRAFRQILQQMNITERRWNELMSIYVPAPGMTRRQEMDARRRLGRALAGNNMTYRQFMQGLHMLGVSDIAVGLQLGFRNAPSVETTVYMRMGQQETVQ